MKCIKKFFKKYYPELLVIIIPIIIMLIASLLNDQYPFGQYPLAKYDGYYQYPGFTSYFKRVLLGDASLFYSFKGLLGYNFYATAIYYLFNPSNILCLFSTNENILSFYSITVYLKIGLCGLTMCKYLRYKFKSKDSMFLIMFSIAYSLIAYNVCYFFNYMYYDVVILFPIVMIGLEKLIHENKVTLFIVSLTISIFANFYIGFMVCIFCLLYFIYSYILLEKKDKRIIRNFVISSLLCGLMAMIILIPVVHELLQGKVDLYSDPLQTDYFKFNLNFLNFFYKVTPGSTVDYDIKYGSVNIYCSLLVIIMVIKYFFNTKISKKEKIVTASFIAFFLLSISFNLIDYAWHLMQRPVWYPNRYIFTFSFFLIMIGYKSFINREHVKMHWLVKLILIAVFILLMLYPAYITNYYEKKFQGIAFLLSIMLIIQYTLFTENKYAKYLLVSLFIVELTINTTFTFKILSNTTNFSSYLYTNDLYTKTFNDIKSQAKDKDFYRIAFTETPTYNSGASYDYNGISIFSSIRNGRIMKLFDDVFDYDVRDSASIVSNNFNPYLSSILGISYINGGEKEKYYKIIKTKGLIALENEDALGLGFMANKEVYNHEFIKDNFVFNTKELVDTMLGKDSNMYIKLDNYEYHNTERKYLDTNNMFVISKIKFDGEETDLNDNNNFYTLLKGTAPCDGFIIANRKAHTSISTTVKINGKEANHYFNGTSTPIFIHKGDTYEFKFVSSFEYYAGYIDMYIYKYDVYKSFIDEMKKNRMEVYDYEKDDHFKAKVTSTKEKNVLFTSIPYDEGWKVIVDGKSIKYKECYDSFICMDLEEGTHEIEFNYIPKGFIIGSIITSISVLLAIVFIRKNKRSFKNIIFKK